MVHTQKVLWYVQGFIKKYKTVIALSATVGVSVFLLLPSLLTLVPFGKPTTYIGRVGSFPLSKLPRDIQEQVSYGLTKVDDEGEVVPALASSFRSEDEGRSYRFTLRPNVFWQDGQAVSPQDINYNFSDMDIIKSASDVIYRIHGADQAENLMDQFLPSSFPAVVSQPLFKQTRSKSVLFRGKTIIVGLGPYTVTDIVYKGPGIQQLTLDSVKDRKIYRFYPTEHDAIVAFKRGEIDILEDIQNIEDLDGWTNVSKRLTPRSDQYVGVFFNLAYKNGEDLPYSNKQLRQALNLAIQKPQGSDRILSPIYKRSWAYVSNEDDLDRFDQDMRLAADTFLKASIFSPLTIELTTIPSYATVAENISRSWEELGTLSKTQCLQENTSPNCEQIAIDVVVRITNVPDPSNYQVMLVGQQIPLDPDQYSIWHSTQPTNFTRYRNAKIDKLLEDGRRTTNKEERKLLYQEFQRLLVKESPAIFLETIKTYRVERKKLL